MVDLAKNGFGTLEDTMSDIATNGTTSLATSFSDMTVSILSDMARMITRAVIVNNLMTALGIGSSGLTGGGLMGMFGGGGDSGGLSASPDTWSLPASDYGLAAGGSVRGPGSGTSDSIPAMLSNGEYVVNARAARQYAPLLDRINNHFAAGGPVGGRSSGGSTTVVVNDNRGSNAPPVEEQRSVDANGNETVRLLIKQEMQKNINRGALDSTMGANYGLKRSGIRR
jgi:hypothetical protein